MYCLQLLDSVEAINKLKNLEKEKTAEEKEAALAQLEKRCEILRTKIKEQEAEDVNKERYETRGKRL